MSDSTAEAVLENLLRSSAQRSTPRCPHFGPCGGCTWQYIPYPEQLRLKTELVTRLVRAVVPRAPAARAMLPGTATDNPWGYRHKVHFVFGSVGGRLTMGHYTGRSRRVIDVRECPVHAEAGNALAFRLKDAYARARITAAPQGTLKSLAIRVGHHTPELMATLVVSEPSDKRLRAATRALLERPDAPTSFHLNVHPRGDAFVFGRDTRRLAGHERMRESVAGVSFLMSPAVFFQTNVGAAEVLVRLVRDAIPAGARVLDLYAGAGLFALPLARDGHDVVAVEENRAAVADGEASLRLNGIPGDRCRFVARRAEDAIGQFARPEKARPAPPDTVVLDPPREGCSPSVTQAVFRTLGPARAVYVSCNPEALARDLGAIVTHGYRIESLQPVDMFPHTAHVETVAVLHRRVETARVAGTQG